VDGEAHAEVAGGTRDAVIRRVFDIVVSASLAVLTLPIMIMAVLGSWVSLRAWPFFTQERVGRDGVSFRFVKIRTLPTSVPTYTDKFQLDLARVPAFCRLLRALHLDELPQLYLVLFGRMSLVGPRPEMQYLHELMPGRFGTERTSVRPGCTGLWQISDACAGLISAAPEYDRFYLANRTLRLDAWVLGRTALKMLGFARPMALSDVPGWTVRSEAPTIVDLRATTTEPYAEPSVVPTTVP
jgi:lipopolysaccharide/colanic/teichoic acid biosynthesis glycosyltransferase